MMLAPVSQISEEQLLYDKFRIGNFKPSIKRNIFKGISWLKGTFLTGEHQGFLKERVKTYQMTPISPLNLSLFFRLNFYCLCPIST
jgi:hypothetical protein